MSITQITKSCDTIRNNLKSIRVQDAKIRTFLGSRYDAVLNNYMKPLNIRLVLNDVALNDTKTQAEFSNAKSLFAADYIDYQRSFEELLAIDCNNDANSFSKKLSLVRQKREKLFQDVTKLNSLLSSHILFVKQIQGTL